jgi:plastocyanin
MKKRILIVGLATVLALAVACSEKPLDNETVEEGADTIVVDGSKFSPRVVEVSPGTEVTWSFEDDKMHDAVGEGWGSEPMRSGTYSSTFEAPGVYDYRCTLHSNMTGRIIVRE